MKFEIGRRLFENFGKLEYGVSKFSNIPIFGRNQMNEPKDMISMAARAPMPCVLILSQLCFPVLLTCHQKDLESSSGF